MTGAKLMSLNNRFFNTINNILHIFIAHVWSCGQAHADLEDVLFYPIGVHLTTGIHGLLVHGLPDRPCLDLGFIESHTQWYASESWVQNLYILSVNEDFKCL